VTSPRAATTSRSPRSTSKSRAAKPPQTPLEPLPEVKWFPPAAPGDTAAVPAAAEPDTAVPPDTRMKYPAVIEWLPVSALDHDERVNTRPVDENWVRRKAPVFNWMLLGTVLISRRADGSNVLIDGQQRAALTGAVAGRDATMKCEVITGLNLREEAELFIGRNANRPVNAISKFYAEVTAGDPVCSAVHRIVTGEGWIISPGSGPARLTCINRLLAIHTKDLTALGVGAVPETRVLASVLQIINAAWGRETDRAGHEAIVWSLGRLLLRDGQRIRDARIAGESGTGWLVRALKEAGATPALLLGRADAMASMMTPKISTPNAVLRTMVDGYNYRAPAAKRLKEFKSRTA
jgi:hypothetical protein